jgi:hypothetical protein
VHWTGEQAAPVADLMEAIQPYVEAVCDISHYFAINA